MVPKKIDVGQRLRQSNQIKGERWKERVETYSEGFEMLSLPMCKQQHGRMVTPAIKRVDLKVLWEHKYMQSLPTFSLGPWQRVLLLAKKYDDNKYHRGRESFLMYCKPYSLTMFGL